MGWRRVIAGGMSLAIGCASVLHGAPTVAAAVRFSAAAAGLDPLTSLAVVRASAAGDVLGDLHAAVEADDLELARSLLDLADARGLAVPDDLRAAVEAMGGAWRSAMRDAAAFGAGAWTGGADSVAGFAGVAVADLMVVGDLRDLAGETAAWWSGDDPDWIVVGLSLAGVAVTAGTVASGVATVASGGAAAPAAEAAAGLRGGLSVVKAVLKAPRRVLGAGREARGLRRLVAPMVEEAVDPAALKRAAAALGTADPAAARRLAADAVDWRKAGRLAGVAHDFEAVRGAAGLRTAVWLGTRVETPAELARGTARLSRLGGKALAVTARLGERVLAGAWRLLGFLWDIVAAVLGAAFAVLHAVAETIGGLRRVLRLLRRFSAVSV